MKIVAIVAVAILAAAPAAVASQLGDDIAESTCTPNAPGYTLSAAEAAAYDSGNVHGGFTWGGSTGYSFTHLSGSSEGQCKEQVSEGSPSFPIRSCRTSAVTRSGNTLRSTGSWTPWGACT